MSGCNPVVLPSPKPKLSPPPPGPQVVLNWAEAEN